MAANSWTATVCAATGAASRARASAAITVALELIATLARARIVLKLAHSVWGTERSGWRLGGSDLASAALVSATAVRAIGTGVLTWSRAEIVRRTSGLVARFLILCLGLCLSLSCGWIHGSPTAVVPLTPVAVRILLVNVAVSTSINVVVIGILGDEAAVAIGTGETGTSTSFGGLEGSCGAIGIGVVLRLGPVVTVVDNRIAPRAVLIVALRSGPRSSGPGIVAGSVRAAAVGVLRSVGVAIHACGRVVPGGASRRAVRTIDRAANSVEAGVGVVHCSASVRVRIRIVDRVRAPIDVGWIIVTGAVDEGRADSHAHDKHAHIAGGITHLHGRRGGAGDDDIGDVIDRGSRRNCVDRRRNGISGLPRTVGRGANKPDALVTEIVAIADTDDLVGCVDSVKHGGGFDRNELRFTGVDDFDL